ncbi:MAG: DNA gyrase modulator, partial [Alphaproteobacteria bacterium]|nr:DNA gyrase modulator [Alphaproteobacteria bacterium]
MTDIAKLDSLFFERTGMDSRRVETLVGDALSGADDGELYLEYRQSESFAYDDSRLKSASFDTTQGFGLRAVSGEATGYGHASELSEAAITRAGKTVKSVRHGMGTVDVRPRPTNQELYEPDNPLQGVDFTAKVKLLQDIDSYARNKDRRVRQVMASLTGNWQAVEILRTDGARVGDIRPLVRLSVSVVVEDGKRKESGSYGSGGRHDYTSMLDGATWRHHV